MAELDMNENQLNISESVYKHIIDYILFNDRNKFTFRNEIGV